MSINYDRGSEWRKWDLHVHTPSSICQNYGGDTDEAWERYISDLESLPQEFSVLGINDYLFIDGYERLKKEKEENNRLQNIDLLLPVLEFRLNNLAGIGFGKLDRINLHVIFSDEIPVNIIKDQFLNTLVQSYIINDGRKWEGVVTKDSLVELGAEIKSGIPAEEINKYGSDLEEGFNNLNLNLENIIQSLNKERFKGKYLIAVGKTEWDAMKWTDASIATKKHIINTADIVFTASESVVKFNSAKEKLVQQCVNSRLLDCSDAHDYSTNLSNKDRIGNCFTWIKADPTFEGLKQVIYEPNERICISEENPFLLFDKPYFSAISIENDLNVFEGETDLNFSKCETIPLNQNLVTIIGGRGEGKSMLVEYLASSFVDNEQSKNGVFNKNGEVKLSYNKTNSDLEEIISFDIIEKKHPLEFIYISQGMLKKYAGESEEKNKLAESMKKLARLSEVSFDDHLDHEIITKTNKYSELKSILEYENEEGISTNSISFLSERKDRVQSFIDNITTEENKKKLKDYASDLESLNKSNNKLSNINELERYLLSAVNDINLKISSLNLSEDIPLIDNSSFDAQQTKIALIKSTVNEDIATARQSVQDVRSRFESYKGDLSTLLEDVKDYQSELDSINSKILEMQSFSTELGNIEVDIFGAGSDISSLLDRMEADYNKQVSDLAKSWSDFKDISLRTDFNDTQKNLMRSMLEDIDAEIVIDFNPDAFYEKVSDCIDGSKWRIKNNNEAKAENFGISDFSSFFNFLRNDFKGMYDRDGIHQDILKDICFKDFHRRDYIKIYPVLKYKNKDLDKVSAGQKGTVYLKMKLATSAFSKPIIFDQPEDDLDNGFIVKDLIELFKELKKYRQVIIVTHNANLVVNADAEQVIVATNDHGKLSYISGSLEDSTINSEICKILEGGDTAFNNRRSKYQNVK